jgi:hypothetical protein
VVNAVAVPKIETVSAHGIIVQNMVKTSFDTCVSSVRARIVEKCSTIMRIRKCTENRAFNIKICHRRFHMLPHQKRIGIF